MAKPRQQKVTLRGQVLPDEYDEEDNIISVLFSDDDETEYLVEPYGPGRELLDLIDEYIEVTGTVRKHEGVYYLTVKSFEYLDEPNVDFDEDWIDDRHDKYWMTPEDDE